MSKFDEYIFNLPNFEDFIYIEFENRLLIIHKNYLIILSVILGGIVGFRILHWASQATKEARKSQRMKKIAQLPRGGTNLTPEQFLQFCFENHEPLQVSNPKIREILKLMLKVSSREKVVLIDKYVLLFAAIIEANQLRIKIPFLEASIRLYNPSKLLSKMAIGFQITVNLIVLAGGIILAVNLKNQAIDAYLASKCHENFQQLLEVDENSMYLKLGPDAIAMNGPRFIVMPEHKDTQIVISSKSKNGGRISAEQELIEANLIRGKSEGFPKKFMPEKLAKQIVPLSQRTKTLKDIRDLDTTEN